MATASRTTDSSVAVARRPRSLLEELRQKPQEFNFFQAVRLLARFASRREMVGQFVPPPREIVRFGAHPGMAFPASQIQTMEWPDGEQPRMIVNFMGMTGPMGEMPLYYTELILERQRAKDTTLRAFLDIFNHRLISLFYQAWEKYRFHIAYERRERDRLSYILLDLIGMGTAGLQRRLPVPDDALLYYSGLLSMHVRPAIGLEQLLSDYFDVPVRVEQFVGAWYALDEDTQCCFDAQNSYSEQLGVGAVVGDEVWDQNSGIRVVVGPLTLAQYRQFLPEGDAYEALRALVQLYGGKELDYELQLVLKRDEVPACDLWIAGDTAPQLGWTTWAKTVPMTRDPGDTILRI